jgi:hypothetical protein
LSIRQIALFHEKGATFTLKLLDDSQPIYVNFDLLKMTYQGKACEVLIMQDLTTNLNINRAQSEVDMYKQ